MERELDGSERIDRIFIPLSVKIRDSGGSRVCNKNNPLETDIQKMGCFHKPFKDQKAVFDHVFTGF